MDIMENLKAAMAEAVPMYSDKVAIYIWCNDEKTEYCIVVSYTDETFEYALQIWQIFILDVTSKEQFNCVDAIVAKETDVESWVTRGW